MTHSALIPVITIDGPTASGKGTVSARVAKTLGFRYLDSGLLYRLAALHAMTIGADLGDEKSVACSIADLECTFQDEQVLLSGKEVGLQVRSEEVGNNASKIAAYPQVRQALTDLQLNFRQKPGLVADGRDMGTVIFPDAPLKIFLTASVEARAQRRYKQLIEKGFSVRMEDLVKDLKERDERDTHRAVAPLKPALGAISLDTSDVSIEDAVKFVLHQYALLQKQG